MWAHGKQRVLQGPDERWRQMLWIMELPMTMTGVRLGGSVDVGSRTYSMRVLKWQGIS